MNNQEQIGGLEQAAEEPAAEEQTTDVPPIAEEPNFRSFSAQLKEAWQIYSKNFAKFFGLTLLSIFVPMALIIVGTALPLISLFVPAAAQYAKYLTFLSGISGLVISLFSVVVSFVGFVAMFVLICDEGVSGVGASFRKAFSFLWRFFAGSIIIGFIFLPAFFIAAVLDYLSHAGEATLLPVVIVFSIPFSLWPFVVIKENSGIFKGIKRCFQLARGHFYVMMVRYFIFFVAMLVVQAGFFLLAWLSFNVSLLLSLAVVVFILLVNQFVFNILGPIFIYIIYGDLSSRKAANSGAIYRLKMKERLMFFLMVVVLALLMIATLFLASYRAGLFGGKNLKPITSADIQLPVNSLGKIDKETKLTEEEINMEEDFRSGVSVNDAKRLADLRQIETAMGMFYSQNGEYPKIRGFLGDNFKCFNSDLTEVKNIRDLTKDSTICDDSFFEIPSPPDTEYMGDYYSYESLCDGQCLPGEKNDFYAITFYLEKDSSGNNLKAGFNCLTPEGFSPGSCAHLDNDSDNDGIGDFEEKYVFKTDLTNPDTDGDGYLDGAEVESGYNPNGPGEL